MNTLSIVGIGCGNISGMTREAYEILSLSHTIVGYKTYIELLRPYFTPSVYKSYGMGEELERVRYALSSASSGKDTAIVCSGDCGVYAMAALAIEASVDYKEVEVRLSPGVTAALGGAALLGSPITADFCIVSLSNILTPQSLIDRRLRAASYGDFPLVLYNPCSKKRAKALEHAVNILLELRAPNTPSGYTRNIGRKGESSTICTLSELTSLDIDMLCTVFIGNSTTKVITHANRQWLVTPRGYNLNPSI